MTNFFMKLTTARVTQQLAIRLSTEMGTNVMLQDVWRVLSQLASNYPILKNELESFYYQLEGKVLDERTEDDKEEEKAKKRAAKKEELEQKLRSSIKHIKQESNSLPEFSSLSTDESDAAHFIMAISKINNAIKEREQSTLLLHYDQGRLLKQAKAQLQIFAFKEVIE